MCSVCLVSLSVPKLDTDYTLLTTNTMLSPHDLSVHLQGRGRNLWYTPPSSFTCIHHTHARINAQRKSGASVIWPTLSDIYGVDKILETPVSTMQNNSVKQQSIASKMTVEMNQHY